VGRLGKLRTSQKTLLVDLRRRRYYIFQAFQIEHRVDAEFLVIPSAASPPRSQMKPYQSLKSMSPQLLRCPYLLVILLANKIAYRRIMPINWQRSECRLSKLHIHSLPLRWCALPSARSGSAGHRRWLQQGGLPQNRSLIICP